MAETTAELTFVASDPGSDDPVLFMYERPGETVKRTYVEEAVKVNVTNARSAQLTLDENGLALAQNSPFSLPREDFYSSADRIQQIHYPEVVQIVKRATGASKVVVFDHNLRNSTVSDAKEGMAEGSAPPASPGGSTVYSPVNFGN